jgi:uncharacterized protein YjbI with pentapeptide repeats
VADGGSGQRPLDFRTVVEDAKALATVVAMEAESLLGRRAARALGVVALGVVGVVVLFLLLNGYIDPTKPRERKDLVLALAQILAGMALLLGLYFTWRTLQVNREGQITERFTRAIDQLGSKELEIRIGGIYALERIARDSERDHWPIIEVLTAYVRQHAVEKRPKEDSRGESATTRVSPPNADIQAILTVIARRKGYYGNGEPEPLDLQGTDLRRSSALGRGGVHLEGAYLQRANLSGAHLEGVYLQGANLSGAHLEGAFMDSYQFLEPQKLVVKGPPVHLENAIFRGARLKEAKLRDARLENAILSEASLERADLYGAHLEGATLDGASLEGARLEGTHLERTDLSRAQGLTQEQVNVAIGDPSTTLPNRLRIPPEWEKPKREGFE